MGAAAPAVMIAGIAYNAYSSYRQAQAAGKAAERNALMANQAAADAEQRGMLSASRIRSATALRMARGKAALMAQGIDGASAGLASVLEGMAFVGETDALTAENDGARQAWGYRNQAAAALYEGEVARQRAWDNMVGGTISGVSDLAGYYERAKTNRAADDLLGEG